MILERLSLEMLRIKLETEDFYDGIVFKNNLIKREFKDNVTKWMNNLQRYKQIKVNKFRDLLSGLEEICFPIKIVNCSGTSCIRIDFVDIRGHMYYMHKMSCYNYADIEEYLIGRRNSPLEPLVDRDFEYKISESGDIILLKSGAMKLDENGLNDGIIVDFKYDFKTNNTEAILWSFSSNNKIRIKYSMISDIFDKKVLDFLFNISEVVEYYDDVFELLEWISEEIPDKKQIISIVAEIEGEISSEIQVDDGIVRKYVSTKRIGKNEIRKSTLVYEKDLEVFLMEKV